MARLSDSIEDFIKSLIAENEKNDIEIKRNELAGQFNCVPSQINYVISTRFSRDKGYLVESRRGGGGCIRITRVEVQHAENEFLKNLMNSIGDTLSQHAATLTLGVVAENALITKREMQIALSSLNDSALSLIAPKDRDRMRAHIMKGILLTIMNNSEF